MLTRTTHDSANTSGVVIKFIDATGAVLSHTVIGVTKIEQGVTHAALRYICIDISEVVC